MMKHRHRGMGRHFTHDHPFCEMRGGFGRHGGHTRLGDREGGRRGGRLFDYGELRLLVLALIAQAPAHGYELIKTIEDRFGGAYTPSPGVIYPTLSWLEDSGYARVEPEGGRKSYAITDEGQAFLAANQDAADALFRRGGHDGEGRRGRSLQVMRAMHNLKTALRMRLTSGPNDEATIEAIAAAIDEAAQKIGKL
ncbi:PadR family transcriptional regulator [Novosphingobium sp. JCM 18896]|uniref:PadR family transcriptional regulator n=1 Tax=Novosphingobium sp. JCM 18896 TaxID=2989731 RepID=UPI0022232B61|nr:PadR family transcriptional regulator [Novosphingobium sp. JCM 18896]MCW1429849.1 PadR family transcriptional regulator [Novosphingobium sp. JCM 18896]